MKTVIEDDAAGSGTTQMDCSSLPTIIRQSFGSGAEEEAEQILLLLQQMENSYNNLNNRVTELEEQLENIDGLAGRLPVGAVIEVDATISDMSEFMGYGDWELFGRGRTTICSGVAVDALGQQRTFTVGETGGELKHPLSANENGEHQHTFGLYNAQIGTKNINNYKVMVQDEGTDCKTTKSGTGAPHENLPPFIVVQRWKRIG